jgi:predicted MFS family arabinose efflux permease
VARPGLTRVFAVREFRVLWAAELLSVLGDQVARVALAVLVYSRTGSGAAAAGVYALTYLPALLGGLLLAWMADRFRRRTVMVVCDLLRAGGIAAMAVPRMPLPALCALLVAVVLLSAPHDAAQGALMPDMLEGEAYEHGLAVRQMTIQTGQLIGFALGGAVVAALGTSVALAIDAATFVVAAVLTRVGLRDRRPADSSGPSTAGVGARLRSIADGVATIARDPRRRVLVALAWTVGWFVVPEGLAAPYAVQIGVEPAAVGLLMAADPLGSVLGAWLFVRFVPAPRRERLVGVLAVAAGLPLLVMVGTPGLVLTLVLWGVAGMCSTAYLLQTQSGFVRATPGARRGSAIGVAASGVVASQGVAMLVGGLLADAVSPARAVAICGGIGSSLALAGAAGWRAVRRGRQADPTGPPLD